MRLQILLGPTALFLLCVAACAEATPTQIPIETSIAKTQEYEEYLRISKEGTERAKPTETPTPTPRPTRTPTPELPEYCHDDPGPYLDEVDRIITGIFDSISTWNGSARNQQALLEHELRLRALVDDAEKLVPPSDFQTMHEHFIAFVQGTLNATFGVIESNEGHREGNNTTYLNEFDLAIELWDASLRDRNRICGYRSSY